MDWNHKVDVNNKRFKTLGSGKRLQAALGGEKMTKATKANVVSAGIRVDSLYATQKGSIWLRTYLSGVNVSSAPNRILTYSQAARRHCAAT